MRDHLELVIFDLDGTLIEDHLIDTPDGLKPRRDRHYTSVVPLERNLAGADRSALERVEELTTGRYGLAIATNQGGVALGFQKPGEVHARIANTLTAFNFFDSAAFSVHWCFDHPNAKVAGYRNPTEDDLWQRKPEPGMLHDAMRSHGAKSWQTVFVGDRTTDEEAAKKAGVAYCGVDRWLAEGIAGFPSS